MRPLLVLLVVRGRWTAAASIGTAIPEGTTRRGRRLLSFEFFLFLFYQLARNTHSRRLGIQQQIPNLGGELCRCGFPQEAFQINLRSFGIHAHRGAVLEPRR
jgi:hypothetical protein